MSLTPISNIGEFSLIEKIAKEIKIYNQEKLVKGSNLTKRHVTHASLWVSRVVFKWLPGCFDKATR